MLRKFFLSVAMSLLAYSQVSAFCCSFLPEVAESSLDIGVGYRQDRIEWTRKPFDFSSSSCSDDWSSDSTEFGDSFGRVKHKWKNLNIWEIGIAGKYVTCNDVYFRGYGDYGWITSGNFRRDFDNSSCSDDFVRNDGFDFSGCRNKIKARGYVYDVSLALGYQFRWCDDSLAFSPLLGYSWHGQHINGKRNNRSSSSSCSSWSSSSSCSCSESCSSSSSSSSSCSSSSSSWSDCSSSSSYSSDFGKHRYHSRWNGPWLGFDLEYAVWCDWTVFFDYEYHWAQYHAKTRRPFFGEFNCFDRWAHQKSTNAHGQRFVLGTTWDFCDCWTAALVGEFSYWRAEKAKEKINANSESCSENRNTCIHESRIKNVNWATGAISILLGYAF